MSEPIEPVHYDPEKAAKYKGADVVDWSQHGYHKEGERWVKNPEEQVKDVKRSGKVRANQKVMNCRWCNLPIIWDRQTKVATEVQSGETHKCPNRPKKAPGPLCACGRETFPVRHCVECRRPVNMCRCFVKEAGHA